MGMAAGLSRSRLDRMRRVLSGHIERKEIAGLVALVSHHDDVHVETLGTLSIDQPTPMQRDAIFRIASLSKPITAVAAMMLVEDCKLRLVTDTSWGPEPPFESAGGGLVATLDDYFAFCRMMLNKGRQGRQQILARATIDLMTSDQLTPAQRAGAAVFFGGYRSWGLGMSIDIRREEIFHTPGRFGWDGGLGTSAYADPAEGMIGILFTQRMLDSPQLPRAFTDFPDLGIRGHGVDTGARRPTSVM
jgi:CubicO group peptidase (beta-lactamase class C family)